VLSQPGLPFLVGAPAWRAPYARPVPPADHRLTLLTRVDCHLCAVAREALSRIAGELGTPWDERDVDAEPELRAEYGDRVPVILLDGREHGYWEVEEARLRKALAT